MAVGRSGPSSNSDGDGGGGGVAAAAVTGRAGAGLRAAPLGAEPVRNAATTAARSAGGPAVRAHVAAGGAHPRLSVAAADVGDEVCQRLWHAPYRVALEERRDLVGRPAGVERPAQRLLAEAVHRRRAPRLDVGQKL